MDRRKIRRRPLSTLGDPCDPRSLVWAAEQFAAWMRVRAFSEQTVSARVRCIGYFIQWCRERGISRAEEVSRPVLESYQRHLYRQRKSDGSPLSFRTQHGRLAALRVLFRFLARQGLVPSNPASDLDMPRLEKRLPRDVLTAAEVERVLAQPDLKNPLGVRDRAILEVFYSTGMRRMELAALGLYDVEPEHGTAFIRLGKGAKDRVVPIGERALAWLERYLLEVRPTLAWNADETTLFLTNEGTRFGLQRLTDMVRRYIEAAELGKRGSCHLLRHTMATLMVEGGADIRIVQQILGHAKLETTELYTHLSIRLVKQVHSAAHPAAKLERPKREGGEPK
jgi:integrase/recombinase XerD